MQTEPPQAGVNEIIETTWASRSKENSAKWLGRKYVQLKRVTI